MAKKPRAMISNIMWNTIGSVYYQGCLWLMTVLVVRFSDDFQNSGYLALAMSIGNVMFALGSYNMRTYQVSDVRNRFSDSDYVSFRLITDAMALLICVIYSIVIARSFISAAISIAFVFFKFDEAFVNVFYGIEQKRMRLDYVGKSYILRGTIFLSGFVSGLLFLHSLLLSVILMALFGFLLTWIFDYRLVKRLVSKPLLRLPLSRKDFRYLFVTCLPSVLALFVSTFIVSGARQYFSLIYGEEALGIYASVATPCVVIQVLAQNLYQPILGPIAQDYSMRSFRSSRNKALFAFGLVGGTGLFISILLSFFAVPILSTLYGSSILPYTYLFFPVLIVSTLAACLGLLTDLLVVFDLIRLTLIINLAALLVMAISLPMACELWFMNGINISLIAGFTSGLILGVSFLIYVLRKNH